MVTAHQINSILKDLHLDALPNATKKAFVRSVSMDIFSSGGWYLAGGTALALQMGHRQSVDLDFFTPRKTFNEKNISETISEGAAWKLTSLSRGTLYGELLGAKMSLIAYPFFKPKEAMRRVGTVSMLTPPDIAAMKIVAISQRGRKRDFVDLYWLCLHVQPLKESIRRAGKQYAVRQSMGHILKSLVYFADADSDPMPRIFFDADWKTVKTYFQTEVPKLAKKILRLDDAL